jgi:hypothetical protein
VGPERGAVTSYDLAVPGADLNPTQQEVLQFLLGLTADGMAADPAQPRPEFPTVLKDELREQLEDALAEPGQLIHKGQTVFVNKGTVTKLHTCEANYIWDRDENQFEWNERNARGTLTHKALQILQSSADGTPLAPADAVDLAVHQLSEQTHWQTGLPDSLAIWISAANAAQLTDLRDSAIDMVTKFGEEFPPIAKQWRPRREAAITATFADNKIRISGKMDLVLGSPKGTTARSLVIDFKTGMFRQSNTDELRMYALLETLRVGVPPWRLATYDLDQGTWVAEDVTLDTLTSAVRRTAAAITKLIQLNFGKRAPTETAGPSCTFCGRLDKCETGQRAREDQD